MTFTPKKEKKKGKNMCSSVLSMSDECLAEKFRQEYNEQFHILVRMHLSFVLDLQMTTEDGEWFFQEQNTNCGGGMNGMKLPKKFLGLYFGKKHHALKITTNGPPLTQEGICQVYQLIEHLKHEQNITSEGIFRRTGSLERMQELRGLLSHGVTVDLSNFRVHDCASVLKGFLAELPEPLLTEAHFPVYCQIAELCGVNGNKTQEGKLLESIQLLLLLLPIENKVLLKDILELLHLTADKEQFNKMSPENLAKLFTPHLLFPRKLSPEYLLQNSQSLFAIVAFMIRNWQDLFKIPAKLMVDFRVRYEKKSTNPPAAILNESVDTAANTVFTFVDHERTAKENESNPTETALAQLYAYIQSLPESARKRKLVKQFNKENGQGTPLQVMRSGGGGRREASQHKGAKRNIFLQKALIKGRKLRRPSLSSTYQQQQNIKDLQCELKSSKILGASSTNDDELHSDSITQDSMAKKQKLNCDNANCNNSDEDDAVDDDINNTKENDFMHKNLVYLTSTPAPTAAVLKTSSSSLNYSAFTPDNPNRKSMSPITRSTHRMTKAMQETMMTPRSRKPVLLVSGTNIHTLPTTVQTPSLAMEQITEEEKAQDDNCDKCPSEHRNDDSLTANFKDYLSSRNIVTADSSNLLLQSTNCPYSPPIDSTFSSRTDDFNSSCDNDSSEEDDYLLNGEVENEMSKSLLFCLNGGRPSSSSLSPMEPIEEDAEGKSVEEEKVLVLKPKQFDEDGKPIVFETSF